jgi:hypothetical protein
MEEEEEEEEKEEETNLKLFLCPCTMIYITMPFKSHNPEATNQ